MIAIENLRHNKDKFNVLKESGKSTKEIEDTINYLLEYLHRWNNSLRNILVIILLICILVVILLWVFRIGKNSHCKKLIYINNVIYTLEAIRDDTTIFENKDSDVLNLNIKIKELNDLNLETKNYPVEVRKV